MTTAERLLADLEEAAKELLLHGQHDGACTNHYQMSLAPKVAPCTKHQSAMKAREARFTRALDNLKLLRDVFGNSGDI